MSKDLFPVLLAYIAALAVAAICVAVLPLSILAKTLLADIAATCVIFAFSRAYKNSSFYDAYWSVTPIAIALYWLWAFDASHMQGLIAAGLVSWWGVRLTLNWAGHWPGMHHEDWRYPPIREKAGKNAAFADFAGIHMFPTLIVFAAMLPVYAVMRYGAGALGWAEMLAIGVTAAAILLETIADLQLHRFVASKKPGEFIQTGVWRYSRHPNYCGEFGFWFGLMLFGLAVHPAGWWWIIPGAAAMLAMFIFVSIPLMDERSLASRTGYAEYMKRTSALLPLPPR